MNSALLLAAAAVGTRIPITNEVLIDGRSMGAGSDLEPFMFQCYSEVYNPPQSMGIVEKGQTVKVVGSEIEVILHMRGRCEGYGSFDYRVGRCSAKSTEVETVSEEKTVEHTIQSYEIK